MSRSLPLGLTFLVAALAGCYEVPPRIPENYGPREIAGWPPPRVYAEEPLHPANRWFHRSFSRRGEGGTLAVAGADAPVSELALGSEPNAVDRAEVRALLAALAQELDSVAPDAVTRLVLHADLLEQARFWRRCGDDDLARLHDETARQVTWEPVEVAGELVPPPLREGEWREAARYVPGSERGAGRARRAYFEVSEADGTSRRAVLIFPWTVPAPDAAGEPVDSGLVAECWETAINDGEPRFAAHRFDRQKWLLEGKPWRTFTGADIVAIAAVGGGEGNADGRRLEGPVVELCGSCHTRERPFTTVSGEQALREPAAR
jgi:hypothetical protein